MCFEVKTSPKNWCSAGSDSILSLVVWTVSLIVIAPLGIFASSNDIARLSFTKPVATAATSAIDGISYFRLPIEQSEIYAASGAGLAPDDSSVFEGASDSVSEDELSTRISRGWTSSAEKSRTIQNPSAALFKSMVVPGWGQVGNKKYIKAGFVIGLESLLFLKWLRFRRKTADARADFEDAPDTEPNKTFLFNKFQATRNDPNLFAWLTGTVIFISMFDAFVDAHLSGFPKAKAEENVEVGDDGGLSLAPFPGSVNEPAVWGAQIKYSF